MTVEERSARGDGVVLLRSAATVSRHEVECLDRRHFPIVIGEPVGHVGAVLYVPQILGVGDFLADIVARLFAQAAQLYPATGQIVAVEEAATERLDADAAPSSTEFVDPLEQQILPIGRQIRN